MVDINKAFAKLRINQLDETLVCSADLVIDDQINPRLETQVPDIKEYSILNDAPYFEPSLKEQFAAQFMDNKIAYDTSFEFIPAVYDDSQDELTYDINIRAVVPDGEPLPEWKSIEFIDWL